MAADTINNDLPIHPEAIALFAQNRCSGRGANYVPYIFTWSISSRGRKCRYADSRYNREHHLLSIPERRVFSLADMDPAIDDILEQYAWPVEDSRSIANELRLQHPRYENCLVPITTDFIFIREDGSRFARSVKMAEDLADPKFMISFELDQELNHRAGIEDWGIITDLEIAEDADRADNWLDLKEYQKPENLALGLGDLEQIKNWSEPELATAVSFEALAKICAHAFAIGTPKVLQAYRHFIATRKWKIDLSLKLDFSRPHQCRQTVFTQSLAKTKAIHAA